MKKRLSPLFFLTVFGVIIADDLEVLVLVLVVALPVFLAPLFAARVHHPAAGIGCLVIFQVIGTEDKVILVLLAVTLNSLRWNRYQTMGNPL